MQKNHDNNGTVCGIEKAPLPMVKEMLEKFSPQLIVELGTYFGGFTKYLATWFPEVPIYTVDFVWLISKEDEDFFLKAKNVTVMITSRLFRGDIVLPQLLSSPIRKLLFCDNGHKEDEIRTYSGFLRAGDLLGVHDFGSEVHYENVAGPLSVFDEHKINEELSKPGFSEMRFYLKKGFGGRHKLPGVLIAKGRDR